ncbi:beta-glucosidase family protein [Glacieibacterium megasporae]|uniref:beta-glucosidase family protein n=1 Tax=Glacieibacterium megasporae TaxID=2835787 RepID=UPI001C1DF193|nr:glycoside hydrolase family 3 C-terminal domain-containing protein [Polymorphobacter megasporae]UAJ11083.1 glycoside hydrolase family 3 C-terminal domain-containing protein [Polymorphobacter megasporae]
MSDGLSLDEQASLTAGGSMWSTLALPDHGIPAVNMADGPMGIASGRVDERDVSLLTPCATALGASWDVALVERVGALVGGEAVRRGVDAVLAPNVNLARSPLSGRAFEYFSEDPYLVGALGAAWTRGLQSTGTAAVVKHLVCNDSETDRDTMNVVVDERALREVYLLPFELAAAAGAGGMLAAYNRVNGSYSAEQAHVLCDIVKREWAFDGVIMSDWFGTHTTAPTMAAGLDLEMPGPARHLGAKVAAAVHAGEVDLVRVEDAATRITRFAQRFTGAKSAPLDLESADDLLTEAAAAGFVLLRNENDLLPLLPGRYPTIAVIGPNADAPCYQGGTFAKIAVTPTAVRPLEAIRRRFEGQARVVYEAGVDPQPRLPAMPVRPARDLGDGCLAGMTIDYFNDLSFEAAPRFSETRATNSLVWFVGVHGQGAWDRPAGIRASGWFQPTSDGDHQFYVGATGAVTMTVDGEEVLRRDEPVAASDVMGTLKRGDADVTSVSLEAGREVLIEIRFRHTPARVQGLWFGVRAPDSPEAMKARAVALARAADAVILIVGETSDSSVESKDRSDTRLPNEQIALIEAVTAVNPRTVIVANVGHAFDALWADRAAAVLVAWYPGQSFGNALAEVLAGDREPGGRMPVTIARAEDDYPAFDLTPDAQGDLPYTDGVGVGWRGIAAPAHAFGSGFGYARFAIEDATVDGLTVSVRVRNLSGRKGSEIVQVYRALPERALAGFAKVNLGPHEAARIRIAIEPRMLRRWAGDCWQPLPGPIELELGRSSNDLPLKVTIVAAPPT